MTRRRFMQSGLAVALGTPVLAALRRERMDEAAETLARATGKGQVAAAVLHVVQGENSFTRSFGKAASAEAMFLLGSISKPISMTALMTLFERGEFRLDDCMGRPGDSHPLRRPDLAPGASCATTSSRSCGRRHCRFSPAGLVSKAWKPKARSGTWRNLARTLRAPCPI